MCEHAPDPWAELTYGLCLLPGTGDMTHDTLLAAETPHGGEESWHRWCLWLHQSCKIIKTDPTHGDGYIIHNTGIRKTDIIMKSLENEKCLLICFYGHFNEQFLCTNGKIKEWMKVLSRPVRSHLFRECSAV